MCIRDRYSGERLISSFYAQWLWNLKCCLQHCTVQIYLTLSLNVRSSSVTSFNLNDRVLTSFLISWHICTVTSHIQTICIRNNAVTYHCHHLFKITLPWLTVSFFCLKYLFPWYHDDDYLSQENPWKPFDFFYKPYATSEAEPTIPKQCRQA